MANQVKTKKSKFKKVFNTYGTALLFALPYLIIFAVFFKPLKKSACNELAPGSDIGVSPNNIVA